MTDDELKAIEGRLHESCRWDARLKLWFWPVYSEDITLDGGEVQALVAEVRKLNAHNAECVRICELRKTDDSACKAFQPYGRRCPDCALGWIIE